MGRRNVTRITGKDLRVVATRNGQSVLKGQSSGDDGMSALLKSLVKRALEGDHETRETAAAMLSSLACQNHFQHSDAVFRAGALRPLVQLLMTGSAKAQGHAAAALHALAHEKPRHQVAIVDSGAVVPLVRLLKVGSAKVQEEAASALAALDADVAHQEFVIAAGCIPPLVAMLKGSSVAAQAYASRALANAAAFDAEDGQNAIVRAGAIPVLLILLSVGKAQTPAAHALAQLARFNTSTQNAISDAGGIAPLLALLGGRNLEAQVQAANALAEIARDNCDTQNAIATAGGIGPLLALLASRSSIAQSRGMAALAQLARKNEENQDAMSAQGGIRPLVQLLVSGSNGPDVQAHAAFALMEISHSNSANQQMVVASGGIAQLATLMKNSQHPEVKVEVAGALWALSEGPDIKVIIAEAYAIQPLVNLLGSDNKRAREHSSSALSSLSRDNTDNQVTITQMLIELLSTGEHDARDEAVRSLWRHARENPTAHDAIAKAGDPAALVELLMSENPDGKDYATWSLSLSITRENQDTVASSGGVQPLIDQLADGRAIIHEQAAAAISKLALNNSETQTAICAQAGVPPLIRLLDGSNPLAVQQSATEAVANLAVEPKVRDEIVGGGGVPPLVLLLEGEGPQIKTSTATALARLSKDHEATQGAVGEAGAIAPLVALLDGKVSFDAQQEAAGALLALADHKPNRLAITSADGITWLVSLLASENSHARAHAEGTLVKLSIEMENRTIIIEKLVGMLRNTDTTGQEQAAAALANLSRESEDNRNAIVGADGIQPILGLLDSESSKARENAVSAITELCRGSKGNQDAIAQVGGITKLVHVLMTVSAGKDPALVHLCALTASAIKEMAKGNTENQNTIADSGAIQPLVTMLAGGGAAAAAGALANLARDHRENQGVIAKAGAIAPLCALVREGSAEAKDRAASAVWSLSTDNGHNKDTIAKLGGIDPLLALLTTGTSERSQSNVSGALAALAVKHPDNRGLSAKRLVGYLGSGAARIGDRGIRVLMTITNFARDSTNNQVAISKAGGIPTLISWLASPQIDAQTEAAHSLLCLAMDNSMTQGQIAKIGGIPPLIGLVRKSSPMAQDYAARALFHLATQPENQMMVFEAGAVRPLVAMLSADGETAAELAAVVLVHLMNAIPAVSLSIADKGGIVPLTALVRAGSPGAQQQAAAALAELALVPSIRDLIANAGAIKQLIRLITSPTADTPETAARVLSHLTLTDDNVDGSADAGELQRALPDSPNASPMRMGGRRRGSAETGFGGRVVAQESMHGSDERRKAIQVAGGVERLISMLDGSNTAGLEIITLTGIGLQGSEAATLGMNEQAAATLADLALNNADMQDAIITAEGVPYLLTLIRTGSPVGQEHAARAIRNLVTFYPIDAALIDNQREIVACGTIPELVQLTKTGSQEAQMLAAAGISELASGAVYEREMHEANKAGQGVPGSGKAEGTDTNNTDRLVLISEAGGITPLVTMLSASNNLARENAAGALMHLALDPANSVAIARANGIGPLVTILDDGTETAHKHAAETILRLAVGNEDNQTHAAKHLVTLLASESAGCLCRTAKVLSKLARANPRTPVIIVNAGAIAPLVQLLSTGTLEVKREVAGALRNLSLNSPETQLAIATGLVALLGTGSAETQEHVTSLLLTLVRDPNNCAAVSRAGAVQRLVMQLRGSSDKLVTAKELAAAVLAQLSMSSDDNVDTIASSHGIRPLVALLSTAAPTAQAHVAAIIADLARRSTANAGAIVNEGAIEYLVSILARNNSDAKEKVDELIRAKAESAGALLCLSMGQPETKRIVAEAGAIELIVALLDETDGLALKKAAGALAALSTDAPENQDAVAKCGGIEKIVALLTSAVQDDKVQAEAAAALAALCDGNKANQSHVPAAGGIEPLVALLQGEREERAKEEAAAALWSLTTKNYDNQVAIAQAGGIPPLTTVLGLDRRAQEKAGGALAALALDNAQNLRAIAELIVSILGSDDRQASAKAARAISRLAREGPANQNAVAEAGGVELLVELLDTGGRAGPSMIKPRGRRSSVSDAEAPVERLPRVSRESMEAAAPPVAAVGLSATALEVNSIRKDMAAAMWAMSAGNPANQVAFAGTGVMQLLVAMLIQPGTKGDIHRVVAGALWSMSGNPSNEVNQIAIAEFGGTIALVRLLKMGTGGAQEPAQETAAGTLSAMAEVEENRVLIADAGGVPLLVTLLDGGTEESKEVAAQALLNLSLTALNQFPIAQGLVGVLTSGTSSGQEHATQVIKNLAHSQANRQAIGKAGGVPELVKQLEAGSNKAMEKAAAALVLIAQEEKHQRQVTNELVKLLASTKESVRQRASDALFALSADEKAARMAARMSTSRTGGVREVEGLVVLLKDGLKDGRVEAQEYALLSLSSINDATSRVTIVASGCIQPLIASLIGENMSQAAEEHAATILAGLAPNEENALAITEHGGVEPLVRLLTKGNLEAKRYSALTIAQLARHAGAGSHIAEAGGASALVGWLADPTSGPTEVAAKALSAIAHDDPDMQTEIVEEGAIPPLVAKIHDWIAAAAAVAGAPGIQSRTSHVATAHRVATVAAGCIATLCKDHCINQLTVAEEDGIPPLLELVRDREISSHENATKALWHLGQAEDNQVAIPAAGGTTPLVRLLKAGNDITKQYAAAALEALAFNHVDNQIALSRAGAIDPLIELLGSSSHDTQQHSVRALINLATFDKRSRDAVVHRLVAVLNLRNAAAQMKAAEALAELAVRSAENRVAITSAKAIQPLVRLLADGTRVKANTPQERAAAVLAGLARLGENKHTIVNLNGIEPLVAMLSSEAPKARASAAGALSQLAGVAINKALLVKAGAIESLVSVLENGPPEGQKLAMAALWHLATVEANKGTMVAAGAIPLLVKLLSAAMDEARENAVAVLSVLARTQGGNKKAIVEAGGIEPLVALLSDGSLTTQKNAACTLWTLADGKEGVYDKKMVDEGAVEPLIAMLLLNNPETCGFAAACLSCLCADKNARRGIIEAGGANPLIALLNSPNTWLRGQASSMLKMLSIPFSEPDPTTPRVISSHSPRAQTQRGGVASLMTAPPLSAQKLLPIRKEKEIDPERDNAKVGELKKGDIAYVLERREVAPGVWRALVATEAGGEPIGWVTAAKEGADFLVSENNSKTGSIVRQMKFKFFPHQIRMATVDSPHFA